MEQTFVMIKPDGVKRRLIGEIVSRIERKGLEIIAMQMLVPNRNVVEAHYGVHRNMDFFEPTCDFTCSGLAVPMVVQGENAITVMRTMAGATKPAERVPGTIRGDLSLDLRENLIHTSDGPENAETEIKLWFPDIAAA